MKNFLTISLLIGATTLMACTGSAGDEGDETDESDDRSDEQVVVPVVPVAADKVEPQRCVRHCAPVDPCGPRGCDGS
jgi:hypothetical protein